MKLTRILPLIIPLMLTACASSTVPDTSSSQQVSQSTNSVTESSSPESSSTDSRDDSLSELPELIGICGEKLDSASFEKDPDELFDNLLFYHTDYGYTALFDGKTYNLRDDPEKFDLDTESCNESREAASGGFFIINKGDTIGGLTCTDANATYFIDPVDHNYPFALYDSTVCFDGEIEVSGYIDRMDGNEGYVEDGELDFYPDGESWQGLPIPFDYYYYQTYFMKDENLVYAPFRISLGVVYDYSSIDLERDIPKGSTAHMKLVLKDLQLKFVNTNFGGYTISTATIVSAEKM